MKKTVKDVHSSEKRVLVRADFNVPLDKGAISDDTRIQASLPTIECLLDQRARVILCSHLGRPKGKVKESLRLNPVAERLSQLLQVDVRKIDECIGPEARTAAEELEPGQALLLENTRFHPEEKQNDPDFAGQLAELTDIFVNDAFAAAHRAHASTEGIAHHLPSVAGCLMHREIKTLQQVLDSPGKAFVAILGGAKISDKIGVVERLLEMADYLLVGGGMANTMLKARDWDVGQSLVEHEALDETRRLLESAGERLVLPESVVVAETFDADAQARTVGIEDIPSGWRIMDVGSGTIQSFQAKLESAQTVVWNGPLGVTEMPRFAQGTLALARYIADLDATTILGGGDSVAAIKQAGVADRMNHVSTGGGAFLEFLKGEELPAIAVLEDHEQQAVSSAGKTEAEA